VADEYRVLNEGEKARKTSCQTQNAPTDAARLSRATVAHASRAMEPRRIWKALPDCSPARPEHSKSGHCGAL
jgi:hypothetical protein